MTDVSLPTDKPTSPDVHSDTLAPATAFSHLAPQLVFLLSPFGMSGSNYVRNLILKAKICDVPSNPLIRKEDWFIHGSDHLTNYIATLGQFWTNAFGDGLSEEISTTKAEILSRFGEALTNIATEGNRKTTIIKTPSTKNLENVHLLFPTAKLIFLIRDGRDACVSRMAAGYDKELEESFRFWSVRSRHMLRFAERAALRKTDDVPLWIRYEDAVREPIQQIQRVANYLGVQLETPNDLVAENLPIYGSSEFGHNKDGTFTKVNVERPVDFDPIGRWKVWPRSTCELFHEVAGRELMDLGYEPDEYWSTLCED
ncbi:hypothetical protein IWQ49_000007 [Labrenzia sp. EL_126]|nr:hypothetical protein [Labrenzia sp. EL_126]